MTITDPEELPTLLVERVAAHVERGGGTLLQRGLVREAVTEVLEEKDLSEAEASIAEAAKEEYEAANDVLSARIGRAFQTGLDLAANFGPVSPELVPTIVALCDTPDEDPATIVGSLPATLAKTRAIGPKAIEGPLLILAQTNLYRTIQGNPAALNTTPSNVMLQPTGLQRKPAPGTPTRASHDRREAEICQIDGILDDLAEKAREWADPLIGVNFEGKYLIQKRIGKGGFGSVYRANDVVFVDNEVAIKVLNGSTATTSEEKVQFQAQLEDFKEEASRLVKLEHPNIVNWKVFDKTKEALKLPDGTPFMLEDTYYLVMELLRGRELKEMLDRENRLPPERTAKILLQVLDALTKAHHMPGGQSILHLDLKPQNVFCLDKENPEEDDKIKVIDFGIGQHVGGKKARPRAEESASTDSVRIAAETSEERETEECVSLDGGLLSVIERSKGCTPEYASPEQCTHMLAPYHLERFGVELTKLDRRADLYSLGVLGFEMLTGKLPWDKPTNRRDFYELHLTKPPRGAGSTDIRVPKKLAGFIDKCLIKDRDKRWKDTHEAYTALERIVNPPPLTKQIVAAVVLTMGLIGFGLWTMFGDTARDSIGVFQNGAVFQAGALGPERQSLELELRGLEIPVANGLRLIRNQSDPDGTVLADWDVSVADGDFVRITAPAMKARFSNSVYLELDPTAAKPQYSQPLELTYIPMDAVRIKSAVVDGQGSLSLDPLGQTLDIVTLGEAGDVTKVTVTSGDVVKSATRDATNPGLWQLAFEELALENGDVELTVAAIDAAGGARTHDYATHVVTERLAFRSLELVGLAPYDGVYLVAADSAVELRADLNRRARLTWSLGDASGAELDRRTETASLKHSVILEIPREAEYSGRISIHIEDESVFHAPSSDRGKNSDDLVFRYTRFVPEFQLQLAGVGANAARPLVAGKLTYLNAAPELRLLRTNDEPVHFEVHAAFPGADPKPVYTQSEAAETRSFDFPIDLPQDDTTLVLTVSARRYNAATDNPEGSAASIDYTLVFDRTSPGLEISVANDLLVRDANARLGSVDLILTDNSIPGLAKGTPIDLSWSIENLSQTLADWTGEWEQGSVLPGTTISFPMPAVTGMPIVIPPPTWDGQYRLTVTARDVVGNPDVSASYVWTVSADGPTIERPIAPVTGLEWKPSERDGLVQWQLTVRVTDPNDVGSVTALVKSRSKGLEPRDVTLELHPDDKTIWIGDTVFGSEWTQRDVELTIDATDRYGNKSSLPPISHTMAVIDEQYPERVAFAFDDNSAVQIERMIYVPGNLAAEYRFHGQADSTEEDMFRDEVHKSYPYNKGQILTKSWSVVFEKGAIESYYLDEHEVTVGQYSEFLRAEDGFGNADLWASAGLIFAAGRLAELRDALRARDDQLPMTDVRWDEAAAYARWVGKELMSFVQWEWAVRGPGYRPYPSYSGEPGFPDVVDVNYNGYPGLSQRSGETSPETWVVDRGSDQTPPGPGAGIFDLGSNVSEWTRNPEEPAGPATTLRHEYVRTHKQLFLVPPAPRDEFQTYYRVGSSFNSDRFDFSVAKQFPRSESASDIGFRCAAPAATVLKVVLSPSSDRIRITPEARAHR